MNAVRTQRSSGVLVATVSALCAASLFFYLREFYHDDAFITLRYAQNLLNGDGLVWNPGERVEGYTSILWLLLCAGLGSWGVDLVVASQLLGVVSFLALIVVLVRLEGRAGWLASLLVCSNGCLVAWALGGLETLGFTVLITFLVLRTRSLGSEAHPGSFLFLGLIFGVAQLVRPEAVLFFLVCTAYLLATRRRKDAPGARGPVLLVLAFLSVVTLHVGWRLVYYGEWLPNTFFAKATWSTASMLSGSRYLLGFAAFQAPLVVLLGYLAVRSLRRAGDRDWLLPAATAVYAVYVVLVGGDHMQWFRFWVPVLPLLYVQAIHGLDGNGVTGRNARLRPLVISALLLFNLGAGAYFGETGWKHRDPAADHGSLAGLYMRQHWPENALVALNTAGSTAYYSRLRCIDMLGLNDRHIARRRLGPDPSLPWTALPGHSKGDGAYVLGRRPDFIVIGGSEGYTSPWFTSDKEIMASEEFRRGYQLETRQVPASDGSAGFAFRYYRRRD